MNRSTSALEGGILLTVGSLVYVIDVASKSVVRYGGSSFDMSTIKPTSGCFAKNAEGEWSGSVCRSTFIALNFPGPLPRGDDMMGVFIHY